MVEAKDYSAHLVGHDGSAQQVAEGFSSGRMHHAWILAGARGIGKRSFARHFAHYVFSGGKNPIGKINKETPQDKLIAGESHPDLLIVRRQMNDKGDMKESVSIDDAREIVPFLSKTPALGGWRVVVIEEADLMSDAAKNAILKVVEEPPKNSLIIMTTTTVGRLLPTIRSRCRVLNMQNLSPASMQVVLMRLRPDLDVGDVGRVIALSGGSAGFALKILETDTLPLYDLLLEMINKPDPLDIHALHHLADQVGRKADSDSFEVLTSLLQEGLYRNLSALARGQGVTPDLMCPNIDSMHFALTVADTVQEVLDKTKKAYLDRKLAFITMVMDIKQAIHPTRL